MKYTYEEIKLFIDYILDHIYVDDEGDIEMYETLMFIVERLEKIERAIENYKDVYYGYDALCEIKKIFKEENK